MENRKIKNENQAALLDMIEEKLKPNATLVNTIADGLDISLDAAYRRMRCDKLMDIDETIKLCRNFNISLDSIIGVTDKTHILSRYTPLDLTDMTAFLTFVQVASNSFENTKLAPEGEIIVSAIAIPIFNILPYRELTLFKLFSWNKSVYDFMGNYETFVKESGAIELLNKNYEKILENYHLTPSTEIWTDGTIDTVLRLLNYHLELKHFSDKESPLLLCKQLMELIDTLHEWAAKGTKGAKGASFKLYVSKTDFESQFVLFKSAKRSSCMVKLYTINGLGISDENFCKETERWLQKLIQRSVLISVASEVERNTFFDTQRQKVQSLIEKIKSDV